MQATKPTDEQLVAKAQAGDNQATEALMLRYGDVVRGRARGFFLLGGETEDLIQEGMIGLYKAIVDYKLNDSSLSFKNFAYLCISRRLIDAVKASARKKNVPLNDYVSIIADDYEDMGLNPEDKLIQSESRKEFMQEMSKELSDFEFRVIVMYIDGLSCLEICQATGKSEKSVDNAIQRSKKKLQKLFKK